ncbi:MAG: hypothetical protein HPY64_00965 [Anaerolineae bacterium]|nr:hypothetical protein [Anaerolineae bacterium]
MILNSNWQITETGIVLAGRRLGITRGQIMMLMVALNLAFLGLDIYLAHSMNGTIRPYEMIPIVFGPAAGLVLLIAGAISLRRRTTAILLAFAVLAASIVVGLLGAYFHVARAIPPSGPGTPDVALALLVFAPPIIGPLTFSLVGVLGVIAATVEDPPDSGRMVVPGLFSWRVPFSKTRQYCIWVGLGILATLLSSVLDHGRFNFENLWVWLPTLVGVFATVAMIAYGMLEKPGRGDTITVIAAMIALIIVGLIGFLLHVRAGLATRSIIVPERFLRGAPFLAPMLFADMGALGLIALLPMREARMRAAVEKEAARQQAP